MARKDDEVQDRLRQLAIAVLVMLDQIAFAYDIARSAGEPGDGAVSQNRGQVRGYALS